MSLRLSDIPSATHPLEGGSIVVADIDTITYNFKDLNLDDPTKSSQYSLEIDSSGQLHATAQHKVRNAAKKPVRREQESAPTPRAPGHYPRTPEPQSTATKKRSPTVKIEQPDPSSGDETPTEQFPNTHHRQTRSSSQPAVPVETSASTHRRSRQKRVVESESDDSSSDHDQEQQHYQPAQASAPPRSRVHVDSDRLRASAPPQSYQAPDHLRASAPPQPYQVPQSSSFRASAPPQLYQDFPLNASILEHKRHQVHEKLLVYRASLALYPRQKISVAIDIVCKGDGNIYAIFDPASHRLWQLVLHPGSQTNNSKKARWIHCTPHAADDLRLIRPYIPAEWKADTAPGDIYLVTSSISGRAETAWFLDSDGWCEITDVWNDPVALEQNHGVRHPTLANQRLTHNDDGPNWITEEFQKRKWRKMTGQ